MKMSQSTNNKQPFRKYMQEKLAITVLVMMLALIALTVILYTMVQNKNEDYTQVVLSHQDYDSRTIPYRRGDIVDRNGSYLATSEKVYTLILDPKQMYEDEKKECVEPTIALLTELFGFDAEDLRSTITGKKDSSYIRYKKQMTFEEKEQFETESKARNEAFTKNSEQKKILGVWFEDEYRRVYPNGSTACNVIGFAQKDGSAGSGGIEQYYNSSLVGNNGREYGYLTSDSNLERVIKPAQNGNTVVSTIDLNIQKICEKYIDEWQAGIGSNVAAAIVMDPKTGEILAMDTSTRYDLNNPYDLSGYYSQEEINAMDDKAKSEAWYKMWRNFCVNDTYEPGSPQKAFTVAGAMEENIINGSETFQCNGFLSIGGHDIHCVSRIVGHGPTTVMQGLMKSCNVVMMNISRMEGVDIFAKYQSIFGFGQKTGIDLPGEADAASLIYTAENMKSADLATNSFGQNYNCTMIQMAAAYASMINGGSYYQPHVVKQILNEQGSVVDKKEPLLVRETISKETSDYINEALYQTVSGEGGTAGAAAVEGYEIAGKTGTAEKYPRAANNYLVDLLESEGAEAVVPDLLDFLLYCFYNQNFKVEKLGFEKKKATTANLGIKALEWFRAPATEAFAASKHFTPPAKIQDLGKMASDIVSLGNQTGEGWFLTGEMLELIHSGAPNIVCTQPFACLPNHVVGKGVIKELRRRYPESNIVAIDFDPGASEVNQLNRLKLMLSTANKNLNK